MSVQSMAIVFGPTLLRPQEESNITMHMVFQNQIVELVLNEFNELFKTKWNYPIKGKRIQPSAPSSDVPIISPEKWTRLLTESISTVPINIFFIRTNQNITTNKCPVKHQEDLHFKTECNLCFWYCWNQENRKPKGSSVDMIKLILLRKTNSDLSRF